MHLSGEFTFAHMDGSAPVSYSNAVALLLTTGTLGVAVRIPNVLIKPDTLHDADATIQISGTYAPEF